MKKLVVEYLPMDSLTAYDGNAKEHPKKQVDEIVQSIKQFGFDDPIAVWGKNNAIVEGHGRLLALQKMSEKDRAKAGVEGGTSPLSAWTICPKKNGGNISSYTTRQTWTLGLIWIR